MNKIIAEWTKALSRFEYSSDSNFVCSSYSLVVLLALLANGATGKTYNEMIKSFEGKDISEINDLIQEVSAQLGENDQLVSSNVVCTTPDYKERFLPEYEQLIKAYFDAVIMASSDNSDLVNLVNNWVNEKTLGMIPDLVDSLDDDIKAVLMNAIAFNGKWLEEYTEDDIANGVFNNSDNTISQVTMLSHKEETYVEDDNVIGFIKEYDGFSYSFMGILPKKEGNKAMMSVLNELDIQHLYTHSQWGKVETKLPEFEISSSYDLTPLCESEGIKTAFSNKAEFGNMITNSDLKVDTILQKAYIKVDSKGTKAAAVTAAIMRCMSVMPDLEDPIVIELDRPFIYAVVNNDTGIPVFMGVVNKL